MSNILVIDDEQDILSVVSLRLKRHGHEVICVRSGEEGLRFLREDKPDLILLDIRMPGLDGYEVCKRIRKSPDLKTIPILFFTIAGDQDREVPKKCAEVGAQGYILKPFSDEDLLEKITHCLSQTVPSTESF